MTPTTNDPLRCFGAGDDLYERYHDEEWGHEVHGDAALYERMTLEGFQSGLSWLTILRKRESFRQAFAGFEPAAVAAFDEADVERLMEDAGIVRNRRKIEAAITNARAVVALQQAGRSLDEVVWSHRPQARATRPAGWEDVPASTDESKALAKELKSLGFVFVGPTTMYALMQACGLVDDHIVGCVAAT
ncbi:DNA-3-methyladenine glycosylase I [Demequina activiva]|uniref:DNA-3-methyladenine glycosylase I n=1 Tax=Demequina activiva TaxID=1582364 RepID=A0A919Q2Q5_9MICO|nr:DNA-3-methyladenine glycosylase I [Demequina activiva]GIG54167.1 DNA-3-methyladenine glycosylase I [Demequina activiva]